MKRSSRRSRDLHDQRESNLSLWHFDRMLSREGYPPALTRRSIQVAATEVSAPPLRLVQNCLRRRQHSICQRISLRWAKLHRPLSLVIDSVGIVLDHQRLPEEAFIAAASMTFFSGGSSLVVRAERQGGRRGTTHCFANLACYIVLCSNCRRKAEDRLRNPDRSERFARIACGCLTVGICHGQRHHQVS